MTSAPDLASAAAWALLHALWQGGSVALLLALGFVVLRGRSPRAHYVAAWAGLGTMAAAPAASAAWLIGQSWGLAGAPASGGPLLGAANYEVATAVVRGHFVLAGAVPWVVGLWAAGVAALLARGARGWWIARGLVARSGLAPEAWEAALGRLSERLGVRRRVRLVVSPRVGSPVLIGWRRPAVVFPAGALASLSGREVEMLLAHELAHVRRGDAVAHALQVLIEALLFFHPAARWASRRASAERERCCDDAVVALFGDPVGYARALLRVAEAERPLPLALGASSGVLLGRVRRLVAPPPPRSTWGARWAGLAAAVLGAALVAGAPALLHPAALTLTGARWIDVSGRDPAGVFTVSLLGARVVAATVEGVPVHPGHLVQRGDSLSVVGASGGRLLSLRLVPGGVRWEARAPRP